MYLARVKGTDRYRYIIRQSYLEGECYRSRDLYDLGEDPCEFIIYPGGNGFYIDADLEDAIADTGIQVSQDDLEPLFLPFLDPYIRRIIDGFDRKQKQRSRTDACVTPDHFHRFDRYRLHFLKLGQVDGRDLRCTPPGFYSSLQYKSRDEIEFDFIAAEQILQPEELARYAYQIFNLQEYFSEIFAGSHPEWLDQGSMDNFFVKSLCLLNEDESFWAGSMAEPGLRNHLVRYAIMYFDNCFPIRDPFQDYLRDFMGRHRIHRPPKSVPVSLAESARLFGVSVEELKKMDCRGLTRRYRKLALTLHPDQGGEQDAFVRLSSAYRKLMERKSRS
jgi:hypothetical protein